MRDRFNEALVPLRKFNGRLGIDPEDLWPLYKKFESVDNRTVPLGGALVQIDPHFYPESSRICPLK